MTELTLEELAELETQRVSPLTYGDQCRYAEALVENGGALLAMARELIRIRSALEFLGHRGHHVICSTQVIPTGLLPRDVIVRATARGWEDPLSTPVAELKGGEG